jgi:hypothetical protein
MITLTISVVEKEDDLFLFILILEADQIYNSIKSSRERIVAACWREIH